MDIVALLQRRGMKVKEIHGWGTYLRKRWEEAFASHLSDDEKTSIYLFDRGGACGFLWHVFSYEKRECLTEIQAEKAFNLEKKDSCYLFYQHSNFALSLEKATALKAEDLSEEMDVYVVDKEFTWTFVHTHEKGWCGPYFSRK